METFQTIIGGVALILALLIGAGVVIAWVLSIVGSIIESHDQYVKDTLRRRWAEMCEGDSHYFHDPALRAMVLAHADAIKRGLDVYEWASTFNHSTEEHGVITAQHLAKALEKADIRVAADREVELQVRLNPDGGLSVVSVNKDGTTNTLLAKFEDSIELYRFLMDVRDGKAPVYNPDSLD